MKQHPIFENLRAPKAPSELREKTLIDATRLFHPRVSDSWTERLWNSRRVRYVWSITTIGAFLFLFFWNPELPGGRTAMNVQQVSNDDHMEMVMPRQNESRAVAQLKNAELLQLVHGEKL